MQEIKNPFQTRFEEFEPEVPEGVWEKINQRLEAEGPPQRTWIQFPNWQWKSAVAASVSVLLLLGWWFMQFKDKPNKDLTFNQNTSFSDSVIATPHSTSISTTNAENPFSTLVANSSSEQSSIIKQTPEISDKSLATLTTNFNPEENKTQKMQEITFSTNQEDSLVPQESKENLVSVVFSAKPDEFGMLSTEPETLRMSEESLMKYLQAKQELRDTKEVSVPLENQIETNKIWKTANSLMQFVSDDESAGYRVLQSNHQTIYTVKLGKFSLTRKISKTNQ